MPSSSSRTPASMIMAGIIQLRQAQINADNWYSKAYCVFNKFNLLPVEAKKSQDNPGGLDIPKPPSAGDKANIGPELMLACRQYIEKYDPMIESAIPVYVYQYFEKGKKAKFGY